jgi:outer membrane biosynthesis protein TonB
VVPVAPAILLSNDSFQGSDMRFRQVVYPAILLALATSASGQEARKAVSKPTPRYPEVAKRLNLVGTVKVEIVIGPMGR